MYNNRIGIIFHMSDLLEEKTGALEDLAIDSIQLQCWEPNLYTKENAKKVLDITSALNLPITSFWAGWSGPKVWNSIDGPFTLGLVPSSYRQKRTEELIAGIDFAHMLGVREVATHLGFIPEHPTYEGYRELVQTITYIGLHARERAIHFNFETGQETPITLMRLIKDCNTGNLGINFDPANLIMYGRGNPIDAIDIYGEYIRGVHIKDGDYSKDFTNLGMERLVGEGTVNFPVFLPKLLKAGYQGDLYIEREISGDQQIIDIKKTIVYIKELMSI